MTENKSQNRPLGYARVSTCGQTLDAQLEQLRKAGCTKIYREKITGARPDRRELLKMLKALAPGDAVTVTRIDRLARSTFDLFAIVKQIVDAKAQFRSLAEPWADTATSTGRLMIAVLGGLADVQRDLIRTRTAGGRERAKARGQHGPTAEAYAPAIERSTAAARARRNAQGTGEKLQRQQIDDFAAWGVMIDRSTIIALLGVFISVLSFTVSGAALWFTWLRRGRLSMTKPTVIFFGYDMEPRLTPKIFLRTLLYSTSARGQVIENMYVKLCRDGSEQVFSFWGYGETRNLTPGSGLFVGQTGVAFNHHFALSMRHQGYQFAAGLYSIIVLARVVGRSAPIRLNEISLTLSEANAGVLAGNEGVLFELAPDTGGYSGHPRE